jgi:isoquinoline 1-oxidoreductase subunit alpha
MKLPVHARGGGDRLELLDRPGRRLRPIADAMSAAVEHDDQVAALDEDSPPPVRDQPHRTGLDVVKPRRAGRRERHAPRCAEIPGSEKARAEPERVKELRECIHAQRNGRNVNRTRRPANPLHSHVPYSIRMASTKLVVNGQSHTLDTEPRTPLLWVLREELGLTATKYGCGIAQCGACTVHLDGEPVRACVTPIARAAGKRVTTLEGLAKPGHLHPLQQAWLAEQVPQCGYCQSGQIMSAAALLAKIPHPTDADIDDAMAGNLCRCGTYLRIRRAIHRTANGGKS